MGQERFRVDALGKAEETQEFKDRQKAFIEKEEEKKKR